MVNKEEVNLFCKNYYGYTMEEANKDIGYWMEKNYELKKENKELHNKIDSAIEVLSKINFDDETEWIPPKRIEPAFKILKGSGVDESRRKR